MRLLPITAGLFATGGWPAIGFAQSPTRSPGSHTPSSATSFVSSKQDRTLADGSRVCRIAFAYAGRPIEDVFWEEPCSAVTAKLVNRADLQALGKWNGLDRFHKSFIAAMPGGRVLYVAGEFSAAIFPVDETGTSIEVAISD